MKNLLLVFALITILATTLFIAPLNATSVILEEQSSFEDYREPSNEEIEQAQLSMVNSGNVRGLGITAILLTVGKLFGKAIAKHYGKLTGVMGIRAFCYGYNDANVAADFLCDAANQYRD